MSNQSVYIANPPIGAASWREPVSTATALPTTASLGDERVAVDTGTNYVWTGSAWQAAGGGSTANKYYVSYGNAALASPTGSYSVIPYNNVLSDSAGLYVNSTGVLTIPSDGAGKWTFNAAALTVATYSATNQLRVALAVNGTIVREFNNIINGSSSGASASISCRYPVNAGDLITFQILSTGSGAFCPGGTIDSYFDATGPG